MAAGEGVGAAVGVPARASDAEGVPVAVFCEGSAGAGVEEAQGEEVEHALAQAETVRVGVSVKDGVPVGHVVGLTV